MKTEEQLNEEILRNQMIGDWINSGFSLNHTITIEISKLARQQGRKAERDRIIEDLTITINEAEGMDEDWRKGAKWLLDQLKNEGEGK